MCEYIFAVGTVVLVIIIVNAMQWWRSGRNQANSTFQNHPLPPGPWSWPIIGNAASLGDAPHLVFDAMSRIYGPIFRIKIGNVPVVVLNDLKVIKEALVGQKEVFAGRPNFASNKLVSLGLGIAFNDPETIGKDWAIRKAKMIRCLHKYAAGKRSAIAKHITDVMAYTIHTLEKRCEESPNGCVDPESVIRVSIGNALCGMCFGKQYQVDNPQFVQLLSMNEEFGLVLGAGNRIDVMPWLKIFPYYRKIADDYEGLCFRIESWVLDRVTECCQCHTPGEVHNIFDSLIEKEMTDYDNKVTDNESAHDSMRILGNMSVLDRVDHRVLSAIVTDIFGAGQDTFASSFMFFLFYMIRYPDTQERIRQDIYNVTGEGSLPQADDCARLPYLEAVYHEIMRHSSLVAVTIPHRTLTDTVLEGFKIPKDTMIFINQYSANHDESLWERPHDFMPERFLEHIEGKYRLDNSKVSKYLIFSTGTRKCPGDEMSKIWLMLAMSTILHQCELFPDPDNPPLDGICFGLTMKPRDLKIRLRKRNTNHML